MEDTDHPVTTPPTRERQTAQLSVCLGKQFGLKLSVDVSSTGLLSIGALVAGILLSSAVIVRSAVKR
jgi:hypothetical protein